LPDQLSLGRRGHGVRSAERRRAGQGGQGAQEEDVVGPRCRARRRLPTGGASARGWGRPITEAGRPVWPGGPCTSNLGGDAHAVSSGKRSANPWCRLTHVLVRVSQLAVVDQSTQL